MEESVPVSKPTSFPSKEFEFAEELSDDIKLQEREAVDPIYFPGSPDIVKDLPQYQPDQQPKPLIDEPLIDFGEESKTKSTDATKGFFSSFKFNAGEDSSSSPDSALKKFKSLFGAKNEDIATYDLKIEAIDSEKHIVESLYFPHEFEVFDQHVDRLVSLQEQQFADLEFHSETAKEIQEKSDHFNEALTQPLVENASPRAVDFNQPEDNLTEKIHREETTEISAQKTDSFNKDSLRQADLEPGIPQEETFVAEEIIFEPKGFEVAYESFQPTSVSFVSEEEKVASDLQQSSEFIAHTEEAIREVYEPEEQTDSWETFRADTEQTEPSERTDIAQVEFDSACEQSLENAVFDTDPFEGSDPFKENDSNFEVDWESQHRAASHRI